MLAGILTKYEVLRIIRAQRGSNPRPPARQAGALPLSYAPLPMEGLEPPTPWRLVSKTSAYANFATSAVRPAGFEPATSPL